MSADHLPSRKPITPGTQIPLSPSHHLTYRPSIHRILVSSTKAFFSGYAVASIPKIVSLILSTLLGKKKGPILFSAAFWKALLRILTKSFTKRLPWFFLVLIGGFRALDRIGWEIVERFGWEGKVKGARLMNVERTVPAERILPAAEGNSVAGDQVDQSVLEKKDVTENIPSKLIPPARNILSPTFFAAAISSILALLIIEPARRVDIALFTLVRAADSFASFQNEKIRAVLGRWLPKFFLDNADTAVFVTCCTQIMYCWFYYPEALPRNYVAWIRKMSHMDPRMLHAVRLLGLGEMVYGKDTGHAKLVGTLAEEMGFGFAAGDPVNGQISCTIAHRGIEGCLPHLHNVWKAGFYDALKIYIPVHLLPAIIFHHKRFTDPQQLVPTVKHVTTAALRSSTFLATFISFVWAPICLVRNITHQDTILGPLLGSFLSGFSILLERKSRRREMGLYCLPKALESAWWRITHKVGLGGFKIPGAEVLMFALGMGYLMSAFRLSPHALRPAIRGLLGFFLV